MQDEDKTKEQLIAELHELRLLLSDSEKDKAEREGVEEALRKTEQQLKQSEREFRESEEKYRSLFDHSMDVILLTKPDGSILDANPAACEMFGRSLEEFRSLGRSGLVDMNDPRLQAALNERARRGAGMAEITMLRANGDKFPAEITSAVFLDADGQRKTSMIIRDITDRKRTEEALWERDLQFKKLCSHVPGMIYQFMKRPDGTYCVPFTTEAIKDIFGCSPQDVREDFSPITRVILAEDLDRVRRSIESSAERMTTWQCAYRVQIPGRSIRWMFGHSTPEQLADGSIIWHGFNTDITDRKRAEEALRESQERLNLALESSRAGTWDRNVVENKATWDDYHHLLFGLAPGTFLGEQEDFLRMVHPDDRDRVSGEMAAALEGDAEYFTTYRVVWPDASVHFLADRGKVYRDSTGRAARMIGISWDIAELKQAEAALKESKQQLADIINFLPDATLVIDREGKVIAWNRAIEEMTGVAAVEMLGKGNYEYALPFYGERRPILIDLVFKPQEQIEANYTIIERRRTVLVGEAYVPALRGNKAHLLGTASILRDSQGNVVGAIESIRDITERKRVEDALARAEAKYRGIFENALEGIYQTTVAGRFISCNPTLARILGYDSPEELLDTVTDIAQQLYVKPEQRGELLRLLDERGTAKKFEVQFFRKDKSVAWVVLNIRGVRDESGRLTYLEGIAQDVTESRVLESQLRQAQKVEAIGTLAGGIAHDFNNILGIIMGYAELAGLALGENPSVRRNFDEVLKATHRAKDLVAQILSVSRKNAQERKPLRLIPIVTEAFKLLRASLPTTIEMRQEIDLSGGNDLVLADPTQIHQVLMNLATNAAHAMRENGGVLRVGLSPANLGSPDVGKPMDLSPGRYLNLTVEDTGHGMDQTIIDRIFDPYFTTRGPGEGTGLGLAVVHGIVKSCGGAITVRSEPGKGTAFHVFLPRLDSGEILEIETLASIPKGNERILLVDDEEALVNAIRQMLEHLGYTVTATTSSTEALSLFLQRGEHLDLVITDYTMPKMTGTDLAREIMQIRPDIPIILCTGFNERISEKSAKEMGISALIMKPVSLRNIGEEVRKVLDRQ